MFCASPADVELDWPRFLPHLVRFERKTKAMSVGQMLVAIKAEKQQLWGLQDERDVHGICVTEIQESPKGRVCLIVAAAGSASKEDKRTLLEHIKAWARSIGCTVVRVMGRTGWARVFPEFRKVAIILEYSL